MTMTPQRQRAFYVFSSLSLAASATILGFALLAPAVSQWPFFATNWLLFASTSFLGLSPGLAWSDRRMSRRDHNIFRVILLAFTGSGLTAMAVGARIV